MAKIQNGVKPDYKITTLDRPTTTWPKTDWPTMDWIKMAKNGSKTVSASRVMTDCGQFMFGQRFRLPILTNPLLVKIICWCFGHVSDRRTTGPPDEEPGEPLIRRQGDMARFCDAPAACRPLGLAQADPKEAPNNLGGPWPCTETTLQREEPRERATSCEIWSGRVKKKREMLGPFGPHPFLALTLWPFSLWAPVI